MSRSLQTTAAALDPLAAIARAPRSRGPLATAAMRFVRNRAALSGSVVLLLIVIACVAGPWLLPNGPIVTPWPISAPSTTDHQMRTPSPRAPTRYQEVSCRYR